MKIAHLEIPHGLFLAPMAGVTDIPFRALCKKYGAECVVTEMVSSRALCYHDKKTEQLAVMPQEERPAFLQIFGNDPACMAEAARLALHFSPDGVDINAGCPAPKIVKSGDGSALLCDPKRLYEVVRAVKEALAPHGVPVTVKLRIGFDETHKNVVENAKMCEMAGADAITVHGRTREQMYAPPVDRESIRAAKQSVGIPVIANGDVTDAESALSMLEETGCDGLMIGRGALGNPYIFHEIRCALEGVPYQKPERTLIFSDMMEHIQALCALKGEYTGIREARKHVGWYIKGMPGAAALRDRVNRAESMEQFMEILENLHERL